MVKMYIRICGTLKKGRISVKVGWNNSVYQLGSLKVIVNDGNLSLRYEKKVAYIDHIQEVFFDDIPKTGRVHSVKATITLAPNVEKSDNVIIELSDKVDPGVV